MFVCVYMCLYNTIMSDITATATIITAITATLITFTDTSTNPLPPIAGGGSSFLSQSPNTGSAVAGACQDDTTENFKMQSRYCIHI